MSKLIVGMTSLINPSEVRVHAHREQRDNIAVNSLTVFWSVRLEILPNSAAINIEEVLLAVMKYKVANSDTVQELKMSKEEGWRIEFLFHAEASDRAMVMSIKNASIDISNKQINVIL